MTNNTSLSLLQRLRMQPGDADWGRFMGVYEPLLRSWLRRKEVLGHDSDDLVQNVLAVVVRRMGEFEHNGRTGAFRAWLRTITLNCLREHWRNLKASPAGVGGSEIQTLIAQLQDPQSQLSRLWDEEHDRQVMRQLLEQMRSEFEPRTWQAFERFALQSRPAAEVAQELGISANAVFIAKSRVLARLRQESEGLLDD
jgi:RNA polymerase sigma-70 factor (ECF subfamily)